MNARCLALGFLMVCLETPGFSQENPLTRGPDLSQDISQEHTTSLDLKAAVRASLAVSMTEMNRVESRRLLVLGQPVAQTSQQQAKENWIQRHPKLFGALVGFAIGCPIGAAQVGGSQDDFFNALDEFACPVLGAIGAAAGAAIGAAVSR